MINLNYLIDHILYQIFKIILSISLKTRNHNNNYPIRRYVNRITFKIKTVHCVKMITPEPMKLIESTKNKITENINGKMCLI